MRHRSFSSSRDKTPRDLRLFFVSCLVVLSVPVVGSYVHALVQPGNSTFALRTGLWLRDHGLSGPVDLLEWSWYTLRKRHALNAERPRLPELPADIIDSHAPLDAPLSQPGPVPCRMAQCAPDEGAWQPLGTRIAGAPAIYAAVFRPDVAHAHVWTVAALIDPTRVRARVVAGTHEPQRFRSAWQGEIPPYRRRRLIAAFNGGFRFADAAGGFYAEGRVGVPLRDGAASLIAHRDGTLDVIAWGRALQSDRDIIAVRQNLALIVTDGHVVDGLLRNLHGEWGTGKNQGLYTWRSGVGVRADGSLVYVAGDGLTLATLAAALRQVACVRGMELDIHDRWVTFALYVRTDKTQDGIRGEKLIPGMAFDGSRYLSPDDKDFVALFSR